jgi:hypothetical protein
MKPQSSKLLDTVIRDTLYTNRISEQAIPTPKELENIRKYSYEKNIKTPKDAEAFRQWVRITYPDKMMSMGLVSQAQFNDLDATKQAMQKKLLRTVWKTYGKEYLEDQGLVDVDTDSNTPWYYRPEFIIGGILVLSAVSIFGGRKLLPKIFGPNGVFIGRAAKRYRTQLALGRADLSPKQVEELVDLILQLRRGARNEYLKKILSTQLAEKDAVAAAEAIASNPGIQNQIHVTLVGEAAENFINGKGFTEDKLKKAMGENLWKQEGPAIKRARKVKTGKVADTIKKPTAAVTLKNMGKLKGTLGQQWANFQNASASAENITNAVGSAIKGNDISLKTKLGIIDTVTKKLKVKLGSKQGAWVLTKHVKSSTFPNFTKWAVDVKSAGVTRTLTETDYLVSKSIWNLTK